MRRILAIAGALITAAAGLVAVAPSAQAAPILCDPNYVDFTWTGVSSPWKLTHGTRYENFGTSAVSWTKSMQYIRQLSATFTVQTGASISGTVGVASLDASVSYSLAVYGSKTSTTTESYTGSIAAGHTVVFFAGDRETTGSYVASKCSSNGQTINNNYSRGQSKSFSSYTEGVVDCANSPGSTTLAYRAKVEVC